jgi:predicted membrane channel-forming protein YqfA (hemolysin III family)
VWQPMQLRLGWGPVVLLAIGGFFYIAGSIMFYTEWPGVIVPGKFGFHEVV